MLFRELKLSDRMLVESTLTKESVGWEYNFATLFSWNAVGKMQIAEQDGFFCISAIFGNKLVFMPPYLKKGGDLLMAVKEIFDYGKSLNRSFSIRGFNESEANILREGGYELFSSRDDSDYIYSSTDLKYLTGKTYHSKRNFVNRFIKEYDYEVVKYDPSDLDGLMELYDKWNTVSSHETMSYERNSIMFALSNAKELDLKITVLKSKGRYVAFSVSSIENNGVAHTLYEKADISFVGAYQAINYFTANEYFPDDIIVNRQEDMGIEGLRKAKLSYAPIYLLNKWSIKG